MLSWLSPWREEFVFLLFPEIQRASLKSWGWQVFAFSTVARVLLHMPIPSFSYAPAKPSQTPASPASTKWGSMEKNIRWLQSAFVSSNPRSALLSYSILGFSKLLHNSSYLLNTSYRLVWCLECLPRVFVFCFSFAGTSFSLDFRPLGGPATSAPCLVEEKLCLCNLSGFFLPSEWIETPSSFLHPTESSTSCLSEFELENFDDWQVINEKRRHTKQKQKQIRGQKNSLIWSLEFPWIQPGPEFCLGTCESCLDIGLLDFHEMLEFFRATFVLVFIHSFIHWFIWGILIKSIFYRVLRIHQETSRHNSLKSWQRQGCRQSLAWRERAPVILRDCGI